MNHLTMENCRERAAKIAVLMADVTNIRPIRVWGVPRGGTPVAALIDGMPDFEMVPHPEQAKFAVDDIVDSGATAHRVARDYGLTTYALVDYREEPRMDGWVQFPWDPPADTDHEDIVRRLLQAIGDDPTREGVLETPKRVVKSWREIYGALRDDPPALKWFDSDADEMVVVKGIDFFSTCEHHLLPFYGHAAVAYIPNGKVVGVSKLARIVDYHARRPQLQEKLASDIGQALACQYTRGVAVSLTGRHLCMMARGIRKGESIMTSNWLQGRFRENTDTRQEFLHAIR